MGSPVSAVVANLYMEFYEDLALESAPHTPRMWKRYVDNTCCIVEKGFEMELLHHLNSIRSCIQFIMEQSERKEYFCHSWTAIFTGTTMAICR